MLTESLPRLLAAAGVLAPPRLRPPRVQLARGGLGVTLTVIEGHILHQMGLDPEGILALRMNICWQRGICLRG